MTQESILAAQQAEEFFHHRHHHHRDQDSLLVLAKFPTAVANRQNTAPGEQEQWWISDNGTGEVLSEPAVNYPTQEDAWAAAYLTSVLGRTEDDIRVAAYYLWEAAGKPEGDDLEFWLSAKGDLENPPSPPLPPPTE